MKKKRRLSNIWDNSHKLYYDLKQKTKKQIWTELLFVVGIGLLSAVIVFLIVSEVINQSKIGKRELLTYSNSRTYIQEYMLEKVSAINQIGTIDDVDVENNLSVEALTEHLESILNDYYINDEYVSDMQLYLVDGKGTILYNDGVIKSLNLIKVIQKANHNEYSDEIDKFIAIYPVTINGEVCYLYNESSLKPYYYEEYTELGNILGFLAGTGIFVFIIFTLTKNKIEYIEYLCRCLGEISKGDLDYKIDVVGEDELAQVAKSIMHMEGRLKEQVEAQIQIEQSKNDLVTNVAHDLRTPLTSIIGYIGLVKAKSYKTQEEAEKYLDIAYNKSEKLKVLIEDLFELTKLHQRGVKLNRTSISLTNLLNQLVEELMPLANDKQIEIETYIDANNTTAFVDIGKITRLFENLVENAIKYCPEGETIYIELRGNEQNIFLAVSNPAEALEQEEIDKFFERFYRADKSRNSTAGGSGLGLAIAKNIVELHGGTIKAQQKQDLLSFKVIMPRMIKE